MRNIFLLILAVSVSSLTPIHPAQGASVCTQIQDRKDYFKLNANKDWSTVSETIKYQKYIELVLKNPGCVSSIDFRNAKGYVEGFLESCPPKKDHILIGVYGMKTLKQMCNWSGQTKKKLLQ